MSFDLGGMFSGLGSWLGDNWQGLAEIGIGAYGANQSSNQAQGAAQVAGRSGQYRPQQVFSPFGNVMSDGNTTQFQAPTDPFSVLPQELIGESANYADLLGSQQGLYGEMGAGYLGELADMGYDPQAAAQSRYDMLTQAAQPEQNRMFQGLEQKLFNQGRLGTSGGGEAFRGFFEAQNQADMNRQLTAQDFAMQQQNHLASLGTGFAGQATSAAANRYGLASDLLGQSRAMFEPMAQLGNFALGAGAPNTTADTQAQIAAGQTSSEYDTYGRIAKEALPGIFQGLGGLFGGGGVSEFPTSSIPKRIGLSGGR